MSHQPPVVAFLESRTGEHMGKLIARIGAIPLHAPALAEQPDIHLDQLRQWLIDWERESESLVIFQTGVGVIALFDAMESLGLAQTFRGLLARSTVVVRGPKPTAALRSREIRIDRSAPSPFTTETLLDAINDVPLDGRVVYVQRHGGPNPELVDGLRNRRAKVIEIAAYRWSLPKDTAPLDQLLAALNEATVDVVIFTSASQVQNLIAYAEGKGRREACCDALKKLDVLSVGPTCSETLRQFGIAVSAEASPPKLGPLMELLERRLKSPGLLNQP